MARLIKLKEANPLIAEVEEFIDLLRADKILGFVMGYTTSEGSEYRNWAGDSTYARGVCTAINHKISHDTEEYD